MKVKELIKLLKQCPPEVEVIQSEDPEGNAFRAIYEVVFDSCFVLPEDHEDDSEEGGVPVVILWPSGWVNTKDGELV